MLPTSRAINRYKAVQVKTSSPGELLILLYDGLFRFLGEAATAMEERNRARAGERLDRAYAILSELASTLRPEVWPELCDNLQGIYTFCMGHIVRANLDQDPGRVREIVRILEPLRSAWTEAVHKVNTGQTSVQAEAAALGA